MNSERIEQMKGILNDFFIKNHSIEECSDGNFKLTSELLKEPVTTTQLTCTNGDDSELKAAIRKSTTLNIKLKFHERAVYNEVEQKVILSKFGDFEKRDDLTSYYRISNNTFVKWAGIHGVKVSSLNSWSPELKNEVIKRVLAGESYKYIASEIGAPENTVYNWIYYQKHNGFFNEKGKKEPKKSNVTKLKTAKKSQSNSSLNDDLSRALYLINEACQIIASTQEKLNTLEEKEQEIGELKAKLQIFKEVMEM